jgi:hypothetical protein
MKLLLISILILSLSSIVISYPLNQSSQLQRNIELAESLFGPEVKGQPHLFELNNDYVLNLQFTKAGDIIAVLVTPKYYLEESKPEWQEPDHAVSLTNREYQEIFSKLERLRELGPLVSKETTGVVTNSRLWLLDQYQQAFVQRVLYRSAQSTKDTPDLVHAFSVYFIHSVEGVVEDKKLVQQIGINKQAKVKIEGCWYLTTQQEFDKAELGHRASLYVAGPLNDVRR